MKIVQLRDAKASLSALVDAAESGEPMVITRAIWLRCSFQSIWARD